MPDIFDVVDLRTLDVVVGYATLDAALTIHQPHEPDWPFIVFHLTDEDGEFAVAYESPRLGDGGPDV